MINIISSYFTKDLACLTLNFTSDLGFEKTYLFLRFETNFSATRMCGANIYLGLFVFYFFEIGELRSDTMLVECQHCML